MPYLLIAAATLALAGPADAGPRVAAGAEPTVVVDAGYDEADMVSMLRRQGYEVYRVERTFLGRIRFLARGEGVMREVVVSRNTGEILRDVVSRAPSSGAGSRTSAGGSVSIAGDGVSVGAGSPGGGLGGTVGGVVDSVGGTVGSVGGTVGGAVGGVVDSVGGTVGGVGGAVGGAVGGLLGN
jgi:hypothetical protein